MKPILLVTKRTNYELHVERVRSTVKKGRMRAAHVERLEQEFSEHQRTLEIIKKNLDKHKIAFDEVTRIDQWPKPASAYQMIISVGGDGTLLAASHKLSQNALLMGVKSSSMSVGYLCACDHSEVEQYVAKIAAQNTPTATVQRLRAKVQRLGTDSVEYSFPVMNDFLFAHKYPACTTRYKLTVKSKYETHKSSGIWIATPTGSSAAIKSAGGYLQSLTARNFQFRVREVFQPHGEPYHLLGGEFDPDHERFEIDSRSEEAVLALDGQHGEIEIAFGDRILFERTEPITLVIDTRRERFVGRV